VTGAAGSIIAEDFDGDGQVDIAVASSVNNTVSLLLGAGDGTFRSQVDSGQATPPVPWLQAISTVTDILT